MLLSFTLFFRNNSADSAVVSHPAFFLISIHVRYIFPRAVIFTSFCLKFLYNVLIFSVILFVLASLQQCNFYMYVEKCFYNALYTLSTFQKRDWGRGRYKSLHDEFALMKNLSPLDLLLTTASKTDIHGFMPSDKMGWWGMSIYVQWPSVPATSGSL